MRHKSRTTSILAIAAAGPGVVNMEVWIIVGATPIPRVVTEIYSQGV
jgi:hypothetical protein